MAELGADYSWARPGGAALAAAGVKGVGRYLASDGRGITAGEYQDLTAHGIGVWLVREGAASGMLGGFARGVADAQIAAQQIAAAGLPSNSLVYAAADWDVSSAQFPACDAYLQGFASVLGVNRTGIYGGLHYLNHAHAAGLAVAFWQAGATSWDHGEAPQMPINFHQTTRTPPLPGTDHNYINDMTTVAGSDATLLLGGFLMALKDEEQSEVLNILRWLQTNLQVPGTAYSYIKPINDKIDDLTPLVKDAQFRVRGTDPRGDMLQLILEKLGQPLAGQVDVKGLADALVGAGVGAAVVDELSARLKS